MADIATPAVARKTEEFTPTQIKLVRDSLGISDDIYQPDRTYIIFDADSGNNNLHIITDTSKTYSITQGDGTQPETFTDTGGTKILNYTAAGRYLITIDGTFNGISTDGESQAEKDQYIAIIAGSNYPTTIIESAFKDCTNLTKIVFSSVTDVEDYAFEGCSLYFAELPVLSTIGAASFSKNYTLTYFITPAFDVKRNPYLALTLTHVDTPFTLNISNYGSMTALSRNRIAFIETGVDELTTYELLFNGTWVKKGNGFSISTSSPFVVTLSETRVAVVWFYSSGLVIKIGTYDFDGTNWALVGNVLTIGTGSTNQPQSAVALSPTRVAYSNLNQQIKFLDFDGTDWTVLYTHSFGKSYAGLTALNETDLVIAYYDSGNEMATYRFNGVDSLDIISNVYTFNDLDNEVPALTKVNEQTIIVVNSKYNKIIIFYFNGLDWVEGCILPLSYTPNGPVALTFMGGKLVLNADGLDELLNFLVTYTPYEY
jgi:hypothetical protein